MSTRERTLIPLGRTEAQVVADVVARLLHVNLVPGTPEAIKKAADAVGVDIESIKQSFFSQKTSAYRLPSLRPPGERAVELTVEPPPVPVLPRETPRAETSSKRREAEQRKPSYKAAHPEPGKRRCAGCGAVKDEAEFPVKDSRTGRRRSYCQPCWKARSRLRYLSVRQTEVLGQVGIRFEIDELDPQLICVLCEKPFRFGDEVGGTASVRHTVCPK